MNKNLIIVFLTILVGCKTKDASSQAKRLFLRASAILTAGQDNKDSLNRAITLIDSALYYDKNNLNYILVESHIFIQLEKYGKAIDACNRALAVDRNSYFALLTKGVVYDKVNNSDSAHAGYRQALNSLELTRFATDIFKDHQRIVLYALMGDTTRFKAKLNEFAERHRNSPDFPAAYDDLKNFRKEEYLHSF